ncbi:MAG TPA: energy transducer TonB [Candidatus Elarobacter sp.]|nr:energy transducer TonB [Candidatus Elarobacter sp.]
MALSLIVSALAASAVLAGTATVPSTALENRSCAFPQAPAAVTYAAEPDWPLEHDVTSGTTSVKVDLTAGGTILGASVVRSSGNVWLDSAALRATRLSSFRPEIRNCSPVAGSYIYVVQFVK